MTTNDPAESAVEAASKRLAANSALKKMGRLAEEENAQEHLKALWAKRISLLIALLLGLLFAYFMLKRF